MKVRAICEDGTVLEKDTKKADAGYAMVAKYENQMRILSLHKSQVQPIVYNDALSCVAVVPVIYL